MIIINLTLENIQPFVQLAPLEMIDELADAYHFALGAVTGEENGQPGSAVGILLYDLVEEPGTQTYVQLKWIYVAQDNRQQDIGNEMMEKFADIINEARIPAAMCEVSALADADPLCAWLEEWGFDFSYEKKYELTLTLEELLDYAFFEETFDLRDLKPIRQISGLQLHKKLDQLAVTNGQLRELLDPGEWEWIAPDISCVVEAAGQIRGIFLVRQLVSGVLEPVFLYGNRKNKKEILEMIQFAAVQAHLNHLPETQVRLRSRSEAAARLIEWLFPDMEPMIVRHGESFAMSEAFCQLREFESELHALEELEESMVIEHMIADGHEMEELQDV